MKKFSIIIPAYNATKYIVACLSSLLSQDYPHDSYEIIVVDDASTDDTVKIINTYVDNYITDNKLITYPNVRLLQHKQNKRQGGGRNTGLKAATGEYVMFLDADDYWIAQNTLSVIDRLLRQYPDLQVLRSVSFNTVKPDAHARYESMAYENDGVTIMSGQENLSTGEFLYEIWTSAYRRDFLINNKLYFRENVFFEDSDWTIKMLWHARSIGLYRFPFYCYRSNPESTTIKPNLKTFEDNVMSISAIDDFCSTIKMPLSCELAVYGRIKESILLFIRISRLYPVKASAACLKSIRRSLLGTATRHYRAMTIFDKIRFCMLRNCPMLVVVMVKCLTLTKRLALKCLGRG